MLVINDIQTGLRLYCAWVGEMYLDVLDLITNQGLRLCSLVFRTSPIESEDRRTLISGSPVEAEPAILYMQKLDGYIRLQPNQSIMICGDFNFLKPALVFSKDSYYHSNEGSLMRELARAAALRGTTTYWQSTQRVWPDSWRLQLLLDGCCGLVD